MTTQTLLIVESPKKARQIAGYLGDGYTVLASYGHVRDLPPKGGGDGELVAGVGRDFEARYEVPEKSRAAVAKLKQAAANAGRVLVATDPDREGEAIAWHLQVLLGLRNAERVTYTEVTPAALRAAIARPRAIDMNLVRAQEARRVLDRLVGYSISPILSQQAGQPLSAGRVQTPAVRLVVEREREIRAFAQRKHYGVELAFAGGWSAQWQVKPHLPAGEKLLLDQAPADLAATVRAVRVLDFADGEAREAPSAPFTTSTMQQEAAKRLGFKVKEVMDAAQGLFDGGHITYHRTDSPNISQEGQALLRAFAASAGLPIAMEPRQWKAKAGAQEGHEATRPTNVEVEEAGETPQERALYKLIRARSLASVLADAVYSTRTAMLEAIDLGPIAGAVPRFEARGRVLTTPGWRAAYGGDAKDEGEEASADERALSNPIPELAKDSRLTVEKATRQDKTTQPARRYTEAALVAELEARGIGRPSTYAAIVARIFTSGYVVNDAKKGKYLMPTSLGEAVVDAVVGKCRFADFDFTAGIEEELDQVAAGFRPSSAVVSMSWRQLETEIATLRAGSLAVAAENPCPDCGKALRRRNGANGFFWGCTGYPECRTSLPDNRGKPGKRAEVSSEHRCREAGCGKPLVHRVKKGKSGFDFWGCTGFPNCRASYKTGADGKPDFASKK